MKDVAQTLNKEDQVLWSVTAINAHLARLRDILGNQIGVTAPQWSILALLENLNDGRGALVKDVATLMNVDASFVSAQANLLQRENLIRKDVAKHDRRSVVLSLTDEGRERMKPAWRNRDRLRMFIQANQSDELVSDLADALDGLQTRLNKAIHVLSAGE